MGSLLPKTHKGNGKKKKTKKQKENMNPRYVYYFAHEVANIILQDDLNESQN